MRLAVYREYHAFIISICFRSTRLEREDARNELSTAHRNDHCSGPDVFYIGIIFEAREESAHGRSCFSSSFTSRARSALVQSDWQRWVGEQQVKLRQQAIAHNDVACISELIFIK